MSAASGWKAIALGTVCVALALAGCGRKGALDVPKHPVAGDPAAAAAPLEASDVASDGFVLDPLIQ